jgi:hypothetical protein
MLGSSRRLHQYSGVFRAFQSEILAASPLAIARFAALKQPDGRFERGRAQVHVPLGGTQVLIPSQFLNRPRRRTPRREVLTERVPQDVCLAAFADRIALCPM